MRWDATGPNEWRLYRLTAVEGSIARLRKVRTPAGVEYEFSIPTATYDVNRYNRAAIITLAGITDLEEAKQAVQTMANLMLDGGNDG